MNKLQFAVENAELIDERKNSSFSTLKIDFFASGKNRHDTYISEETLIKTASTIYNCPLVWAYDPVMDDIYTHTHNEVPCGFVPKDGEIEYKNLEDGRTMLSIVCYVWKKYSGRFLEFFKRDGDKPVSVEISVYGAEEREDGLVELTDFVYEAITILGTFVTPAIPNANASVIRFSEEKEEYAKIYQNEFSSKYDEIDFTIPDKVKKNAQKGLNLYKEHGRGGTSVSLSIARFFVKNEKITPEKARTVSKYFQRHKKDKFESNPPSDGYISWMLLGGNEALKWVNPIVTQMSDIDEKGMTYFSDKKEMDEMKEPKKEKVKDKAEEEEKMGDMPMKDEEMPQEQKCAEEETPEEDKGETPEDEKKEGEYAESKSEENPEEDKTESPEDEKKEETPDEKEKQQMSLGEEEQDFAATIALLEEEKKQLFATIEEKQGELDKLNAEVVGLREFKANVEKDRMAFEIESTLKEVEDVMSKDLISACRDDASNYSIETVDVWKNAVRAKAFEFSKGKKSDGISRIGLPFSGNEPKKSSLWG